MKCFQAGLFCLLLAGLSARVRAEVVLTNFSSARPLKIMPVGDSITDDCFGNGAYRLSLQSLLESNGYAFTFVGRNVSSATGGFTKTRHEGYCGVPIAPPGYYEVHGYSGTDAYLEKIVPDALTNATPDVILLLIGANDIGHGRNPGCVATNDMPVLLDHIFAKAPAVNVIIGKITSLTNGSWGYGNYCTNVPIYNAALQEMVNARRAAGQNVFLADCFSAVDIGTGFQGDHVHPNASGFNSLAHEWFKNLQAITIRTNLAVSTRQ
jgi:lysophospholipase L1-like esterase